jgi:CRISPR system Cascade subunit CasE
MHATLSRAFSRPEEKCPPGRFLWRLEPELDSMGHPRVIIQSRILPNWSGIGVNGWLKDASGPLDLQEKLGLHSLQSGFRFRFRLRANPCATRNGKRIGLMHEEAQQRWIERQGERCGFKLILSCDEDGLSLPSRTLALKISSQKMIVSKQQSGNTIHVFSVLFDGILIVIDAEKLKHALENGIGHGKSIGLGLLSLAPLEKIRMERA